MRTYFYFHIFVLVGCSLIGCGWQPIKAQSGSVLQESSYVDMSPAELEQLLEYLITTKSRLGARQSDYSLLLRSSPTSSTTLKTDAIADRLTNIELNLERLLARTAVVSSSKGNEDFALQQIQEDIHLLAEQVERIEEIVASEQHRLLLERVPVVSSNQPVIVEQPDQSAASVIDSLIAFLLQETADQPTNTSLPRVDTLLSVSRDTIFVIPEGAREQQNTTAVVLPATISAPVPGRRDSLVIIEQIAVAGKVEHQWPALHFENNSAALSPAMFNTLEVVAEDFRPDFDLIRIIGFASPDGNITYNQVLANKRATAVSNALQQLGVPLQSLQLLVGGVDYRWSNPAAARRVEVITVRQD